MNFILTDLQCNFDFHMDYNSDTGTSIFQCIFTSGMVVSRWQEIEMHYIINGD